MIIKYFSWLLIVLLIAGCTTRSPKRDQIPLIKANLAKLVVAIKDSNRVAIDSLLSPSILEKNQSSDSLLKIIYGDADTNYEFEQLGNAEIYYTTSQGRIDCFIMDSTHTRNRPLTLYLKYEHDLWLISSFRYGPANDSLLTK